MGNFSDMLTLEGAGRRRNDVRSTFRVLQKTLAYNGSNYVTMWKVIGITFILQTDKEISEKRKFFTLWRCYPETKRDIGMGRQRSNDG